jgi:hypothetical protein
VRAFGSLLRWFDIVLMAHRVDFHELQSFVFPQTLQHPASAGRLIVFGLYGPLKGGKLTSGHRGQHVIAGWELDSMCSSVEREDILQVYVSADQPLAVLSSAQQDAIIAQATCKFEQLKPAQMLVLFAQLPQAEDGTFSFHDMQQVIMRFREQRIEDCKVRLMYFYQLGGTQWRLFIDKQSVYTFADQSRGIVIARCTV